MLRKVLQNSFLNSGHKEKYGDLLRERLGLSVRFWLRASLTGGEKKSGCALRDAVCYAACPLFRAILAGKGRYGRQKDLLHGI